MSGKEHAINISHELNHAKSAFITELERSSKYSTISEQVSKLSSDFQLPESSLEFSFGFGQHKNLGELPGSNVGQDVLDNFYEYSTRYAVIVMITSSEMYLTRLLWIAKVCNYLKNHEGFLLAENFFQLGAKAKKESRYSSVPNLVNKISKELGNEISFENLPLFESIYNARNCLAHRCGEISTEDVDENGLFKLLWKTFEFLVNGEPVKQIKGLTLEAGSKIGFRIVIKEKVLSVGEKLVLSLQDCQNIALTLAAFSEDMRQIIDNSAREIIHGA